MIKQEENELKRMIGEKIFPIVPEFIYSVREAMAYFGVHRISVYRYVTAKVKPLKAMKLNNGRCVLFRGSDLIAFKACGLPKRGRKRLHVQAG